MIDIDTMTNLERNHFELFIGGLGHLLIGGIVYGLYKLVVYLFW